jgi:hypothetical protein
MNRSLSSAAFGIALLVLGTSSAFAFTQVTNDGYPSTVLSTRLADPDDIMDHMASRQSGGASTITHFGGTTLQVFGPSGGGMATSPFVNDPAMGTVPSKREGW